VSFQEGFATSNHYYSKRVKTKRRKERRKQREMRGGVGGEGGCVVGRRESKCTPAADKVGGRGRGSIPKGRAFMITLGGEGGIP